ncbi:MAG: SPFH domain-containing protein, partial [Clostridia bacterium]|nr:SPFH domain-containing protein [Clostridia bacterium]
FGMIRLLGHGEYSFHVEDPKTFMKECFGTVHSYDSNKIHEHLKDIVLMELTDLLGESEIPALDLASKYREIGDQVRDKVAEKFNKLGVAADEVIIKNIKLPEAVEQAMDKRTTLGVIGDQMSTYAQYESVGAMRDAAKNPGAGGMFAAMGVGLGAGARIGAGFGENIDSAMGVKPAKPTVECSKCGHKMAVDAKFCPECGEKTAKTIRCSNCGKDIAESSKFCPECGTPAVAKCPGCGKDIKGDIKFCPECGYKLK